jgi:RNA polymerase sigma-70 factor (ECF subfamily)
MMLQPQKAGSQRRDLWRQVIATADPNQLRKLLAECSLGSRQAFESLYRTTSGILYAVALRCLGRKDLAEEVVQEAFVRIWHNASGYDANLSQPLTWMVSITRNLAIDQRRKHREVPLNDYLIQALQDHAPQAAEQLSATREANALQRCIELLDGMQKAAITTAYFHGLSCTELAAQLGAPLGSVKSWIRRGMERLRRCLES